MKITSLICERTNNNFVIILESNIYPYRRYDLTTLYCRQDYGYTNIKNGSFYTKNFNKGYWIYMINNSYYRNRVIYTNDWRTI